MNKYTVIDLFCGSGGFSEGFRQQGFKIVAGIDNWQPAINTFNHNFNLDNKAKNILEFHNIDLINNLPDTDIIIGSPPCVNFSSSNKSGNANKDSGIKLIEIYLKIIALKKFQPDSKLKAWFMENVVNSIKYMKDSYTFKNLQLEEWAEKYNINPNHIAINIKDNHQILNSADFGVAQNRKRLFAGELISEKRFLALEKTHKNNHISVKQIFRYFPAPFNNQKVITDPNYKHLKLQKELLTDYSYDTGIYKSHWEYSELCKTNHSYMGKMSFPEDKNRPSRTITATKLDNSREAIIYDSEIKRNEDGQYRTPTIREISVLMSFPITYQFLGSENTKWRLIGNAVCPLVSAHIAKAILINLNKKPPRFSKIQKKPNLKSTSNLNATESKKFDNPPKFKKGKRFRRHLFKDGNMTVALSNYCLKKNTRTSDNIWRATITYGTGKNFKLQEIRAAKQESVRKFIEEKFIDGEEFLNQVHNGFTEKIAKSEELQDMYENNYSNGKNHPVELIKIAQNLVEKYANDETIDAGNIFQYKKRIYKRQLYALYTINQINKITNRK